MNVRPAGREACECASPINQILERLDQMDADIASAQQAANTAVGTATAQAGTAAASAASAQADAAAALINAGAAQDAADDAHDEAVAAAASAQDAADDAADALLALQNIESTIASVLASDIGGKVDKLTTAGFHLYSHNGSNQGEVAPDINPTAATIPIRDSSGKLFGADPASGATDKTLVTANWVSQTGDSAPNNLVHKSGNEDVAGKKTFYQPTGWFFGSNSTAIPATNRFNIVSIPRSSLSGTRGHLAIWLKNRTRADSLVLSIYHHANTAQDLEVVVPHQGNTTKTWTLSQDSDNIYLSFNGDGNIGADGWYAQGIFSVQTNLRAIGTAFQSTGIVGTEIRSLTL